jgi:hypothetical protein
MKVSCLVLRPQLPRRLLCQALLIFDCQDLAGDCRGGLDHQTAYLSLELGEHSRMVRSGSGAGLVRDVFGGFDGLLSLLLPQPCGSAARLLNDCVASLLARANTSWRCVSVFASSALICSLLAKPWAMSSRRVDSILRIGL